jgi:hypothetical protein
MEVNRVLGGVAFVHDHPFLVGSFKQPRISPDALEDSKECLEMTRAIFGTSIAYAVPIYVRVPVVICLAGLVPQRERAGISF